MAHLDMEMGSASHEKTGCFACRWWWFKVFPEKSVSKVVAMARQTKKVGKDDPRIVIHSLKVGLALTLVSLFYYFQPLYHSFGVFTMWAVMTVVVVFEYSVGATIGKGMSRVLATLLAGALGLGAQHLASMTGKVGEPIVIGLVVFLQAVASTFIRFLPNVKGRYDYGLVIFVLTFCLVSISGFRTSEILELAQQRISTILIGASTCIIVSIFVYLVWAGEDLHDLVANNFEKLGNFLESFGEEYIKGSENAEMQNDKSFLSDYKSVLNSKSIEETLSNFARWEPGHGQFLYRHPLRQYLKIGTLTRQCACRVEALNGYLNSEIKVPHEVREMVKEPFRITSKECGEALKELAIAVRTMKRPSSPSAHIAKEKIVAGNLKSLLKSGPFENVRPQQVIPVAAVASLLADVVICVDNIAESVNELASLAQFKSPDLNVPESKIPSGECLVRHLPEKDCPHVFSINVTSPETWEQKSLSRDSKDHQDASQNTKV